MGLNMLNNNFEIDIENIKTDLAIEGLTLSDEDVSLLKKFADNKISMDEMITTIKETTIERIK